MAFTLKIQGKGVFGNRKINFSTMLSNCSLKYGSNDGFYILKEGEMKNETAILYNPNRLGRGIFFDGREMDKGKIELSYNIPTTESEIIDFLNLVKEIERQLKKINIYCVEEERTFTVPELIGQQEKMVEFSLNSLNRFCGNENYKAYILTLAMWPLVLTKQQVEEFSMCCNLHDFEQLLHEKQNLDVYYAKPRLLKNNNTGSIGAFYVLTEDCESIFPIKADGFINLDGLEIQEGFIQFYIFSEDRLEEGLFEYKKFIQKMLNMGVVSFDTEHIIIPPLTKEKIKEVIMSIT